MAEALRAAILERPEGRDDDGLRAVGDEGAEGFGEGEVPADQQADAAQGRVECEVGGVDGGGG
jgi:hypothetical protein